MSAAASTTSSTTAAATLPLLAHATLDSTVAWRNGRAIPARQFIADASALAASLPPGAHVLNVCADRYHFAVGLAAAMLANKISLLPSTHTPETIRHLQNFAPDTFCLADAGAPAIDLPRHAYPDVMPALNAADVRAIPRIPIEQIVAYVFTSGSTGLPQPHQKRWGALVRNVQIEARLLGIDGEHNGQTVLVATVPPQHMYGFESSVLMALQGGAVLHAGKPFYPADIADALVEARAAAVETRAAAASVALITTPFHLRTLLDALEDLPKIDLIVSATAPLSPQLALAAETRTGAPLLEIYGSTETGQIAVRRPTAGQTWQLFDGVRLSVDDAGMTWAQGGHVLQRTPIQDVIEALSDTAFLLHGRTADLVNIAGKRTSLIYLNQQLNMIPGVEDGVFFMPDEEDADGITRLAAFVVAPTLPMPALLRALQERIDAIFLPRPLILLNALPRNATGKLPRNVLAQALREHLREPARTPPQA